MHERQVVYIDVLFAVNLIINYFILLAESKLLHRSDRRTRLFSGACLGAVYSLFIFFPQLDFLYTALLKIIFSVSIVFISFKYSTLKNLLKLVAVFYIISALFGGIIFALWYFVAPTGLTVRNGVAYFDISPVVLILASGVCYVAITLFSSFLHRNARVADVLKTQIFIGERSAEAKALLDTGNDLCDGISGLPVMVAEYGAVEKLIPLQLKSFFRGDGLGPAAHEAEAAGSAWAGRLRVVPYDSLGRSGGLLPAFRPDRILVQTDGEKVETDRVVIAVSPKKLSRDGSFNSIFNPHILTEFSSEPIANKQKKLKKEPEKLF